MTTTIQMMTSHKKEIPDRLFFRIGDVAEIVGVKPYVLRYWETEFPAIVPEKSPSGQRVYRRSDVETILMIKHLLYDERYSVEGARKRLKELKKKDPAATQTTEVIESTPASEQIRAIAEEIGELSKVNVSDLFSC